MRQYFLFTILLIFSFTSGYCQSQQDNFLLKIYNGEFDEVGVECGYINLNSDTIIPMGKYYYCYTDTLKEFAIVLDYDNNCKAIDREENILFEIFWYDNGPDFFADGLIRIIKSGKIGYAAKNGQIIIEPLFECATPFKNEKAKVTYKCTLKRVDEHTEMESDNWFYIDKSGKKIK